MPVSLVAILVVIATSLPAAAMPPTAGGQEPLRSVAEINRLRPADLRARPRASLRGVVTFKGSMIVVEDDGRPVPVVTNVPSASRVQRGDVVEVDGHLVPGGYAPTLVAERLEVVGQEPLPAARPADFTALFRGDCELERVVLQGVVQDADHNRSGGLWKLLVDADARRLTVAIEADTWPAAEFTALIDAEVRVTGVVVAMRNSRGEFLGPEILVADPADLQTVVAPPADPFAAVAVPLESIATFRDRPRNAHRIRTAGTVSHVAGRRLFIEDGAMGMRVDLVGEPGSPADAAAPAFAPGDRVEVAGFVDMTRLLGGLIGAVARRIGSAPPPEPVDVVIPDVAQLDASFRVQAWITDPGSYDGRLVRCRGTVEAVETLPDGLRLRLESSGVRWFAECLMPPESQRPGGLAAGARVAVTGIMQADLDSPRLGGILVDHPAIARLTVLARQPGDVVLTRAAPWWTARRLALAAAALAVAAAALAAWSITLGRQVRRQTAIAVAEATARQRQQDEYEVAIRERSRIAADLHDTLLQTITGIGYQLRFCKAGLGGPTPAGLDEPLHTAEQLVGYARRQIRSTVWSLRSMPDLRQPLRDAVASLVRTLAGGQGVTADVTAAGTPREVPEAVARQLLFVVQEAFLNAVHHGAARTISVSIAFPTAAEMLGITIRDDGRGFSVGTQPGPETGHFGMQGMRERAELLGGELRIASQPGQGTAVTLRVPCGEHAPPPRDTPPVEDA